MQSTTAVNRRYPEFRLACRRQEIGPFQLRGALTPEGVERLRQAQLDALRPRLMQQLETSARGYWGNTASAWTSHPWIYPFMMDYGNPLQYSIYSFTLERGDKPGLIVTVRRAGTYNIPSERIQPFEDLTLRSIWEINAIIRMHNPTAVE